MSNMQNAHPLWTPELVLRVFDVEKLRKTVAVVMVAIAISLKPLAAQDEAATSAPIMNPFNLKGDDLGAMASYVNQFTGEVVFPMNLVSIPGPGGLGINVSISYNSANIENLIKIWNQEAPTGILGLGWSMETPIIMVDNKQTGAREDDDFYLVEGGSSTRLICVAINSGVRNYRTSTFSNWIIEYTESSEKWVVTKDDGMKYIYGDTQGSANAVQYTARWGNWMGQSTASGQQLQAMIWNLREIRSVWGDRITYSYTVGNISYGQGTLSTEYSLLYKINDAWGHEVEFVPGQKTTDEYQSPPGVVLKRSERFFISKILTKTNGVLDYEQQFTYATNELGTGQLTKRLLKSIKKVLPSGTVAPPVSFEYATAVQGNKGALKKVILPTGGSIIFTYSNGGFFYQKLISTTENAPSGYAEPDVYIADDYALVTWRQLSGGSHVEGPMTTLARVMDWKGKWRTIDLGSVGSPKFLNNNKDYRVVLAKDFFATLVPYYGTNNYTLNIWRRKNGISGEWHHTGETLDMGTGVYNPRVRLFAGNNFVCATNNNGKVFRYVWNGKEWSQSTISEAPGERWTTATNNYILTHDPSPNPDVIKLYYLDQMMNWQTRTQSVTGFNSALVDEGEGHMTVWHPANSSAFVMANESNEMIIQWDENYNNITRVDPGWYYGDNSNVYFDGSTLGLTTEVFLDLPNPFPLSKNRALRRSGNSWIDTGEKINGYGFASEAGNFPKYGMAAFGPEIMVWNSNTGSSSTFNFKYQTFDPVTSTWSSEVQLSNTDNPHVNVGPDYFTVGRKMYLRTGSGYALASQQHLYGSDDVFPSSRRFIASASRIIWMRNGEIELDFDYSAGKYRVRNSTSHPYRYMVGSSIYVNGSTGYENNFQDDTSLFFRKITAVAGAYDFPAVMVQIDDGTAQQSISFEYANPVFGPNESSVMYNKVTMVPASSSPSNRPNGYTETYYYNTLNAAEVSRPFLTAVPNGNGHQYHNLLTGQAYRSTIYKAGGQPGDSVSSSYSIMNISEDYYSGPPYYYLQTPRPYRSISIQDGKTEIAEFTFSVSGKRELTRKTASTKYSSGLWDQRYEEPTYGWQVYSGMASLNMLSQTVLTKQGIVGGSVLQAAASRWKSWTCSGTYCASSSIPAPVDQFVWRGTGSSTFSAWDVATQTPNSDWKSGSIILTRDASSGIETETGTPTNQKSAGVFDNLKRPIASVSNAGISDISFSSFEDGSTGLWSASDGTVTTGTARTGKKCFAVGTSGLSRSGLTTSTAYRVTFWAKTSGGSVIIDGVGTVNLGTLSDWTLFQYTVTGLSSFGIRRSGATEVLLDEVRLHPTSAMMGTKTYHDVFGVDSETDANNRTIFTEFDEFGQPRFVRDQNKNIIKHSFTNRK